jgi:hypothetical protein
LFTIRNLSGEAVMRHGGIRLGRAIGAVAILSMALSAVSARAADEMSGPPCSATVKDHCIEGASGEGAKSHKHAVHHRKHKAATTKAAAPAKPAPAKPAAAAPAKPKAK